jgi:hypothetical protein
LYTPSYPKFAEPVALPSFWKYTSMLDVLARGVRDLGEFCRASDVDPQPVGAVPAAGLP